MADGAHVRILLGKGLEILVDLLVHTLHSLVHLEIPPALSVGVAAILLLRRQLLPVARPLALRPHVVSSVIRPRVNIGDLPGLSNSLRLSQQSVACVSLLKARCTQMLNHTQMLNQSHDTHRTCPAVANRRQGTCVHICTYICIYQYIHVYIYMYMHMDMYIYIYAYVYTYTYIYYIYVYAYIYTYTYIYIYIYAYLQVYLFIYTCTHSTPCATRSGLPFTRVSTCSQKEKNHIHRT